uniref:Kielin/chordin-like protein isoform X1 n=1 Tax=Geotrypetes seraphini TaxID=260995 RepID=A0A6P8SGA1_GEOSA|nr:kielin/chordin-like protein isoform X1 [Geotrypetes seraphini]
MSWLRSMLVTQALLGPGLLLSLETGNLDLPLNYFDDNVIDLLEALNVTRSIRGVSKARGLEPEVPAWKFRPRVPHLILPWDYSVYLLSTMQSSIGFHFVAKQAKNNEGTIISFVSPGAMKRDGRPLLQLISSTRSNQLRLEYRSAQTMDPASILFPGGTPFAESKWARVALNLENHKMTLFVDCEEAIIFEKNDGEGMLSLILPLDLEITFASMPGDKVSKFLGYWQTAEISPSGFLRRPWHCENRSDSLSLPYTMAEERYMDQLEQSVDHKAPTPLKIQPPSNIHNYQEHQSEPASFPGTGRSLFPKATQEERLHRLEEQLESLSNMLDMVKTQNMDLLVRVKYLETCECRRPVCSWEGKEYTDDDSWVKDGCTLCVCVKGEIKCSLHQDRPRCLGCPDGHQEGETWRPEPCTSCSCLNGNVQCDGLVCPDLNCLDQYTPLGDCCPICRPGCEYEGQQYQNGDYFLARSNPCLNCSCLNNLVRCIPVQCQEVTCSSPRPGQCCPTCPACELDGQALEPGQNVSTADGCRRCMCKDGELVCTDVRQCSQHCTHGIKPPFGSCCADCSVCDFHGQLIPSGVSFVSNGNACERCVCLDGNIICELFSCPALECVESEEVPGECCKRCRSCMDGSTRHSNGENWTLHADPCQTCRCQEGRTVCQKRQCASLCRNPASPRPGTCCPVCDGCSFQEQQYISGELVTNGDPCVKCTCTKGNVHCNPVSCPATACPNPIHQPGECCPRCEECTFDSQTYREGDLFKAPSDPCLSCKCTDGNVHCHEEICPPVTCAKPIRDPHYCCAICKVCVLDGTEFEEGVEWEPDGDPCSSCTCFNGETVCGATQCPAISCLHPTQSNGDCCPNCEQCTYNKRVYSDGQQFIDPDNPCQTCQCKDGTVQCSPIVCPMSCSRPERKAGQCCPKCPDCLFEGRVFVDGEQFANPLNSCQVCGCSNGQVACEDRDCSRALCSYPLPGSCCKNNCNGCNYAGKEYPNGADFPHPIDRCKQCHCINGNVQCLAKRCPPLLCSEPFLLPGDCCPQCPAPPAGCLYSGGSFGHMQRFYDPSEKCRDCICNNGTITCQRKPCAPVQCSHPLQQGCCRSCDGCLLDGKELANGEQFPDPSDACAYCVCWEGSISCERRPCPALECPFPARGRCCRECEGCEYLGEEFLNNQEFLDAQNPCSHCLCANGFVTCKQKPCYKPSCSHPITLPGKCCPVCEGCFYHGVTIGNGQNFPDAKDALCSQCTCRGGSVQCVRRLCSPASCPHPVTGPCDCPLCQGCRFQGQDYVDGEVFPASESRCEQCRCLRGEVTCGAKMCPAVTCSHPAADSCHCPVCDGCSYNGRDCGNGEDFPDPEDKCRQCTCMNGGVTCVPVTCQPVSCQHPIIPPGECCPFCTGVCGYSGQVYESGAVFDSPGDGCTKCTCLNEVVTCHPKPCPKQCSHPLPTSASACCPLCDHCWYEDQEYDNYQTFYPAFNPCQRCSCLHGNVLCTPVVCPQSTCANPVSKPGQCCPECQVCRHQGKEYGEGSHWVPASDACKECTCTLGEVSCTDVHCDISCTHPSRVPGQCCPLCHDCLFEGRLYHSGDSFDADVCRHCVCQTGTVHCITTQCPPLGCRHLVTDPGSCCPRCRGCVYNGQEHHNGSSWFSPTTPCMSCMCVDSVTTCSEIRCVTSCVNQIQVPGECCPLCADCVHNGQVYSPGESFRPSEDPCEICICELMPDGQLYRNCNRKQCPSLLGCPKSHILLPGPDHCCPTCAQALSNCTASLVGSEIHDSNDPCFTCQCKDLTWVCVHQGCPLLSCPSTEHFIPHNSCCPACDECVIEAENRRMPDGESWTDSADDCVTCTCNLGHVECHIEECIPLLCQDGLVKVRTPGRCCYECQDPNMSCSYQGQMYQSNEHWEVDECTSCTCVSGEVHCQSERCPQVSCAADETPALIPGMCCPHCIPRPATCIAFGDPHYRTFDGKMFHFQGSCTYVLAEDCEGGDFSIHTTNDDRGRRGVSWTKEVTVLIGDVVIQLLQDWVVMVDYQTVDLPFLKEPYIYIERKTNTILLNTNIGVKVLWNGKSHLEVSVPGTYKGSMCGLCGNFNNYPQDDLRIRTGQIVHSEATFGNSWKVQSSNHTSQCSDGQDIEPCKEAGYRAHKEANVKCKTLKSRAFESCHGVVAPEVFFASCVYDLCACGSSVDECLCDALEAYASECREAGIVLQWRSPSLCAVGCPHDRGYVFDECGPPCPKTCFNKDVPLGVIESHCFKPCIPGCQCPAGLVEHESHCILPEACPKIIYGNL